MVERFVTITNSSSAFYYCIFKLLKTRLCCQFSVYQSLFCHLISASQSVIKSKSQIQQHSDSVGIISNFKDGEDSEKLMTEVATLLAEINFIFAEVSNISRVVCFFSDP